MADDIVSRIKRKIHLDKENAWGLGVCAGIANYWRIDPAFIRVGVIVAGLFMAKFVIAAYLIAWVVLDERPLMQRAEDILQRGSGASAGRASSESPTDDSR